MNKAPPDRATVCGALQGDDKRIIPPQPDLFNLDFATAFFQEILDDRHNPYWKPRWAAETPEAVAALLRRQPGDVLASFAVWSACFRRAAIAEVCRGGRA